MDNINNINNQSIINAPVSISQESELNVTTIGQLQTYSQGTIVKFPDFAEGQPFVAKVRRPSMLLLVKQGKIPNSLLNTATKLFIHGGSGTKEEKNINLLSEMYEVCKVICQSTLISPTFEEIESAGVNLTDEQLMAIFNYSQLGVKALDSFR